MTPDQLAEIRRKHNCPPGCHTCRLLDEVERLQPPPERCPVCKSRTGRQQEDAKASVDGYVVYRGECLHEWEGPGATYVSSDRLAQYHAYKDERDAAQAGFQEALQDLEEARAELKQLREAKFKVAHAATMDELDDLRAERVRLREALQNIQQSGCHCIGVGHQENCSSELARRALEGEK